MRNKFNYHHIGISIKDSFEEDVINLNFLDELIKIEKELKELNEEIKQNIKKDIENNSKNQNVKTNKKITDFYEKKRRNSLMRLLQFKKKKKEILVKKLKIEKKKNKDTNIKKEEIENKINMLIRENEKNYKKFIKKINEIIEIQTKLNVPIISLHLSGNFEPNTLKSLVLLEDHENEFDDIIKLGIKYSEDVNNRIKNLFNNLMSNELIHKYKIKVSVLGKWYDLPESVIDSIKRIINETKDYDNYFLNICINYDGQEEILSATKIIAKKVEVGRLRPEEITDEDLKDNIYSSYFPPPEKIIIFNIINKTEGFLMWDSKNSIIQFENRRFININKKELEKIIKK